MPFKSVFAKNYYAIILISLLLVALSFVDNVIGFSFLDTYEERSSFSLMSFLTTIFIVNVTGQYVLIISVLKLSFSTFRLRSTNIIFPHISMLILVTINAVIFLSLIGVAFQTQKYNLDALKFLIAYNLLISIGIIGILAYKMVTWLMKNRNPSILLYSAAFGIFCVVGISALAIMLMELEGRISSISPEPNPWDRTSTRELLVSDIYSISSLAMFVIVWLATSLLLRSYVVNYVKRIGKKMFWILVSLPLAYYLISSDFVLNQFIPIIFDYPYLANLITYSFGAAKQVGGVFFAISFIFMLKKAASRQLKITLALSAAGIMMLFSSIQITILQTHSVSTIWIEYPINYANNFISFTSWTILFSQIDFL